MSIYAEDEFHLKIKEGDVGRYVILCGDPGRCEKIASYFDDAELMSSNREFAIYTGTLEGEKVSVCSTGIGGPSAAIAVEELVHCGADTMIRTGTAGGMREDVMGGDLAIATGAIRMEGATKEYVPVEFPAVADFDVVGALREAADKIGAHYHIGVFGSKDSFYGQHEPDSMPIGYELKNKWEAWMRMGTIASEMETAALFIVGMARGVRTGSVVAIFGNQTRRDKGLDDPQNLSTETAVKVAVEAMRIIVLADQSYTG